ncbi:MAG TPA: GNAT family N-acetyltransferase [Longimicrobium sp.]|jgi:GNAT superfamily N-acetyltransferase
MSTATERGLGIRVARDEADVRRCWPAFRELRPHLASEDEFAARWRRQAPEGYTLAFVDAGDGVPAAIGVRLMHTMAWGRILYVDDLVAMETVHGTGMGHALLAWAQDEARRLGCDAVHLDTGYQRHRAHRLYLRSGFRLECHHLAWPVDHG